MKVKVGNDQEIAQSETSGKHAREMCTPSNPTSTYM